MLAISQNNPQGRCSPLLGLNYRDLEKLIIPLESILLEGDHTEIAPM